MLYSLTRFPAKVLLGTYFRQVHISHAHRIPKDVPVILAANHPTAFLEPCILACWLDTPLYFLVRGNLFEKPFYARLLEAYHMIAVYRLKDGGYGVIRNNFETFQTAYEKLATNKPIMILAEGRTIHEKRLRPLMKGTARLALGTMEQYDLPEVYVVPVGVNFTTPNSPRSEAMITFGEPILASAFRKEYQENNNKGILSLTKELKVQLQKDVLIIEDESRDEITERFFSYYRNDHPLPFWPVTYQTDLRLLDHQAIAEKINSLSDDEFSQLGAASDSYENALQEAGISDRVFRDRESWSPFQRLLLVLASIPAALGYFLNWPLAALARLIVKKRVKHIEFVASVFVTIILGGYLFYWPLIFLAFSSAGSAWLALFLPFLGYFYVIFRGYFNRWRNWKLWEGLSKEQRDQLQLMRSSLISEIPVGQGKSS